MNLNPPKYLLVVTMTMAFLIVSIAGLPRVSSSYAQIQQESSGRSTPSARPTPPPSSLQVTVQYPPDGTISPGKPQVVQAEVIIGPPQGVSPHKYQVVAKLSDAGGHLVRSHAYHPAGVQSVGRISMRYLPPGDYTFSTELLYAGTSVAQSGSSMIKKNGRTPKSSTTPTPTPAPSGTATPTPVPGYATTWLGNSFGGGWYADDVPAAKMHMQQTAMDMTVLSTGVAIINTVWDEGHMWLGMYQDGNIVGQMQCPFTSPYGHGGTAITHNASYVYATQSTGAGTTYLGRWNFNGTIAGFSGGAGCGNLQTVDSSGGSELWGVTASSTEVFLTDAATNLVKVYDANTMAFKRQWSFTNPRRIVFDSSSNTLWISSGSTSTEPNKSFKGNIYHQDLNGNTLGGTITTVISPTALSMNGTSLWVADDGPDQQIKIFDSSGTQISTFGIQGGYLSGTPGLLAGNKLARPNGLGFDGAGNIYVLGAGSTMDAIVTDARQSTAVGLSKYSPSGALQWTISASGSFDDEAVADPTSDGQDFYSSLGHFKFNYGNLTTGAGGGGTEWSWYSHTMDVVHYPDDPRQYCFFPAIIGHGGVQTIGGQKYIAVTDQYGINLMIFHMVGEIAKPMVLFGAKWNSAWPNSPGSGQPFLWQDTNNNGNEDAGEFTNTNVIGAFNKSWQLDTNGDAWSVATSGGHLIRFIMQGINANGQLTYNTSAYTDYGIPAPFTTLGEADYDRTNDVMYISGFTAGRPIGNGNGEVVARDSGTVIARYNNWLAGNRTATWTANLPQVSSGTWGLSIFPTAWKEAGSRIFVGIQMTQGTPAGTQYTTVTHNIYVYDAATGTSLGEIQPGPETNYYMGWIDQQEALSAYQRSTGEYVVTEEEQIGAKVTILRGLLNTLTQY